MSRRATDWQIEFLKKYDISPPPTYAACRTLYWFVKNGNGTGGTTPAHRANIVKKYQKKFIGQRVAYHVDQNRHGTVRYIYAKSTAAIIAQREFEKYPHPFKGIVDWDDEGRSRRKISLGALIFLND
jgi:hypothetical protein